MDWASVLIDGILGLLSQGVHSIEDSVGLAQPEAPRTLPNRKQESSMWASAWLSSSQPLAIATLSASRTSSAW